MKTKLYFFVAWTLVNAVTLRCCCTLTQGIWLLMRKNIMEKCQICTPGWGTMEVVVSVIPIDPCQTL